MLQSYEYSNYKKYFVEYKRMKSFLNTEDFEAIRYGDRRFFIAHPDLDNAPIWILFDSTNPEYNRFENWGTLKDYK